MKHLLTVLGLVLVINMSIAQDAGIIFADTQWEEILQKAVDEDKIIFVDAYTTWCGPCKKMAKEVFTDAGVGSFYNQHFINAKIDMEKGEGLLFARAYDVNAYPTFLFIDKRGDLVHKALGYRQADDFIAIGEASMDPERSLAGMAESYEDGNREPAFLKHYAESLADARHETEDDIVAAYLDTQEDWLSGDNAEFIFKYSGYDPNTEMMKFILNNREAFEECFDIIRKCWTEEMLSYDGKFWKIPPGDVPWDLETTDKWGKGVENGILREVGVVPKPQSPGRPWV